MSLQISKFVANPGRQFPIAVTLPGGTPEPDALCIVETIEVTGEAFAQQGTLFLEASLHARITQPCRRCLEPVTTPLEIRESFEIPIPPHTDTVELLPVVLRLVLSAHDVNVVCRADCRGLCQGCGINLNEHPDHMCKRTGDQPTKLKDFLA